MTAREFAERLTVIEDYYDVCSLPVAEYIEIIHTIEGDVERGNVDEYIRRLKDEMDIDDADDWFIKECRELLKAVNEMKGG